MCFGQSLLSRRDSARSASSRAAGLAARAVVGLVLGVDDALHRRAADGARLAEAAVHRHLRPERGDLLREAVAGLARSRSVHSRERRRASPRTGASIVVVVERARQRERREPRAVQDLVGVGVADAAEEARIGERALERVVLARRRARERVARRRRAPRGRRGRAPRAPSRPRTRCSDARRLRARLGERSACRASNSNARQRACAGGFAPGARQRRRPAIIRWMTRKSSPSSARTMRLPSRSTPTTRLALDRGERRLDRAQQERAGRRATRSSALADDAWRSARSR